MRLFLPILIVVLVALPGCAKRELPPPCATADLASIEAAYVAEAVETCRGRTTRTCAELPAIEAKYATKREEWIRCRR